MRHCCCSGGCAMRRFYLLLRSNCDRKFFGIQRKVTSFAGIVAWSSLFVLLRCAPFVCRRLNVHNRGDASAVAQRASQKYSRRSPRAASHVRAQWPSLVWLVVRAQLGDLTGRQQLRRSVQCHPEIGGARTAACRRLHLRRCTFIMWNGNTTTSSSRTASPLPPPRAMTNLKEECVRIDVRVQLFS